MSDKKNKPKKFKKRGQDSSSSTSSSSESTSSLSSEDESNANDLKPIKDYLNDRKELARQLFIAVKGDKLRMMLPQVLKKMEIKELEEWCANELSGMSKARILSIINGHPMLQSSDSNDSDDSGPSLEIISDTEEWGDASDLETLAREEDSVSKKASGSKKDKSRSKRVRSALDKGTNKETEKSKSKSLMKGKLKSEGDPKSQKSNELVKIKKETTEGNEQQAKEKDGESLLDLLELEMRARAIRALIRKEEDIIPTNPSGSANASAQSQPQSSTSNQASKTDSTVATTSKNRARDRQMSLKVVQDKLQELDNNFNRNVNKNTQEISEEEDVVLVLAPTTTIELLSSESEDEEGQGKRRNQKLENERIPEKNKASVPNETEGEKIELDDKGEKETENEPSANEKTDLSSSSSNQTKNLSEETEKTVQKSPKKVSTDLEKFRKFKRKSHIKEIENIEKIQEDNSNNSTNSNCEEKESSSEISQSEKNCGEAISEEKTEELSNNTKDDDSKDDEKKPEENVEEVNETIPKEIEEAEKVDRGKELKQEEIDEDNKSTDLEIIIDLDDYPDDMEDLENGGDKEKTVKLNSNLNPEAKKVEIEKEEAAKSSEQIEGRSAETWATRYYQTDDVQSVIKESKIQSEIRKRLRERQRLARLNNSPNLNAGQNVTPGPTLGAEKISAEKEDSPTTMGSVEEYLALKNVEAVIPAAENDAGVTGENEEIEKDLDIEKSVILGEENDSEKTELVDNDQQKSSLQIIKDCDKGGE